VCGSVEECPLISRVRSVGIAILAISLACRCAKTQESIIFSFSDLTISGSDENPASSPVFDAKGNLYGTTAGGFPKGSVFELTPEADGHWTERLIYQYQGLGGDDLGTMASPIMDSKGNLYWAAPFGGKYQCGMIYMLTPKANETWSGKVLHFFGETAGDGCLSTSALTIDDKGNLFGTTENGGEHGKGTVFKVTPEADGGWTEKVIWSFSGFPVDGAVPQAPLILDSRGDLYGATTGGGSNPLAREDEGTVFELIPQVSGSWSEKVLFNFGATLCDGVEPEAGLIFDRQGNLYGTTIEGGAGANTQGMVFELMPALSGTWTEKILHSFYQSSGDGIHPQANLIFDSKGNLFGTTTSGGAFGDGTVFELKRGANGVWDEKIVHNFGAYEADGQSPQAGLRLDRFGNLFGTTYLGGGAEDGTVFEIANPDITAVPQFSLLPGTYTSTQKVTISDYTPGAKIYFTTDGDEPSAESSDEYSGPIEVKHTETLKAIAIAEGLSDSSPAAAKYVIHLPAATPEITPPAASYNAPQKVAIEDTTADAAIYYSTNGSTATPTSGKFYRGPQAELEGAPAITAARSKWARSWCLPSSPRPQAACSRRQSRAA
jgi:uncharacterized repeat protein (TIGR03803 family)